MEKGKNRPAAVPVFDLLFLLAAVYGLVFLACSIEGLQFRLGVVPNRCSSAWVPSLVPEAEGESKVGVGLLYRFLFGMPPFP